MRELASECETEGVLFLSEVALDLEPVGAVLLLFHHDMLMIEIEMQKTGQNATKNWKKVQRRKKSKKLVKKACKVGGDVVLYLSAKR